MRIAARLVVGAAAFMGVSSIACAATAVGNITSLNIAKHSLTLDRVSRRIKLFPYSQCA